MKRLVLVLALSCLSAGCPAQPLDEATMRPKESALNKLAAALEAVVRYGEPPADITGEQLKALATRKNPAQYDSLKDVLVRVRRQGKDSSVLVCTADGSRALLEDAGCTEKPELRYWDKPQTVPCEFRLDLSQACR